MESESVEVSAFESKRSLIEVESVGNQSRKDWDVSEVNVPDKLEDYEEEEAEGHIVLGLS